MIELRAGPARALVGPNHGAALAALEVAGLPVLRPLERGREADPFAWAMNVLAPFSNRVSVPVVAEGRAVRLEPNLPGEPFPIHGDAFQRAWQVQDAAADAARLALPDGAFGPLRYAAELTFRLFPDRLDARLVLRSRAAGPLPYGGGFHPWFPRSDATRIAFRAGGWWPEGDRHLPRTREPVPVPQDLDFAAPRPLPEGWINAGFDAWSGPAVIRQGPEAVSCALTATGLTTLHLYSPGRGADFFCLEPVSHPVDAHALPGHPGLRFLRPGEAMSVAIALTWAPTGSGG
jgi:aldose 1-epimerase